MSEESNKSEKENNKLNSLLNKKVDLLNFQKLLNQKFNEVVNDEIIDFYKEKDELGLVDEVANVKILFSLKDLRKISNDNRMESVNLVKTWILGFNQLQGETFTIIDIDNIVSNILEVESVQNRNNKKDLSNHSKHSLLDNHDSKSAKSKSYNIVYLKNVSKFAILLKELNLKNTKELKLLWENSLDVSSDFAQIKEYYENNKTFLNLEEKNVFQKIIDYESYGSAGSDNTVEDADKSIDTHKETDLLDHDNEKNKKIPIVHLINNVYLDESINKPVFNINIENLIKMLITISPF